MRALFKSRCSACITARSRLPDTRGILRFPLCGWDDLVTDFLNPRALAVFTLKTTGAETLMEIDALEKQVLAHAEKAGLSLIARTHLTYNRQEFTVFFEKTMD